MLVSDPARPEPLVLAMAADPTPRTSLKRARRFLRDDVEGNYVVVDRRCSQSIHKGLDLGARKYNNKRTNISNLKNKTRKGDDDNPKDEDHLDVKQAAVLSAGTKEQVPFEEKVSSEHLRNKRIPVDFRAKKLEPQFISVSAYL